MPAYLHEKIAAEGRSERLALRQAEETLAAIRSYVRRHGSGRGGGWAHADYNAQHDVVVTLRARIRGITNNESEAEHA